MVTTNTNNNGICKEHTGLVARLCTCEANVSKLWGKWDRMQITIVGIFVTLSLNLIGVVFLLIRSG
jgi:hypothetical protein